LVIGGHEFKRPVQTLIFVILILVASWAPIFFFYHHDVPVPATFRGVVIGFCTMVASLIGGLLVVMVYQLTALRPALLKESEKENSGLLFEMAEFTFWLGLTIFTFYVFSIGAAMSILLFGGLNRWSFAATCLDLAVAAFIIPCCRRLMAYWRCHRTAGLKVAVLVVAGSSDMLCVLAFFLPVKFNPVAVLIGLSAFSVALATLSLVTNLSYPLAIVLDSFRYAKELAALNRLLEQGRRANLDGNELRQFNAIESRWRLLDNSPYGPGSYIDLEGLEKDTTRLVDITQTGQENQGPPEKGEVRPDA
jgi:hypothetical protein